YGRAHMELVRAEREGDLELKMKAYDRAVESLNKFINKYPSHSRRGEALGDIGYAYQSKGKYLMTRAKTDPTKLGPAEESFKAAERLFLEQIQALEGARQKLPKQEDGSVNPASPEFESWNQQLMYAKYNYGISLFSHAETYKDMPERHQEMQRLLEQMNKFFLDKFMWDYEWYLLAYHAFIYMGRSYQILAKASPVHAAEDHWRNCFSYIGK
ncbi:MAG: tetratricopeptide repeat protein, partial [Planctomycetota bacterium]